MREYTTIVVNGEKMVISQEKTIRQPFLSGYKYPTLFFDLST